MWAKAHDAERSRERSKNAQKSISGAWESIRVHILWLSCTICALWADHRGLQVSHSLFQCKLFTGRVAQLCSMPVIEWSQPVHQPWIKPTDKIWSVKIATSNAGGRAPQRKTTGSPFASIYFVFRCVLEVKMYLKINLLTDFLSSLQTSQHLPLNGICHMVPHMNKTRIT